MRAPLRSAASTTITPKLSPLMMRLRCGNMPRERRHRRRRFADHGAVSRNFVRQFRMLRRKHVEHAAGEHGDRASAGRQRAAMRRRVDAAGQAADHGHARASSARRPAARPAACRSAWPAACRRCRRPSRRPARSLPRTNSTPGGSGISVEQPRIVRAAGQQHAQAVLAGQGKLRIELHLVPRVRRCAAKSLARCPALPAGRPRKPQSRSPRRRNARPAASAGSAPRRASAPAESPRGRASVKLELAVATSAILESRWLFASGAKREQRLP